MFLTIINNVIFVFVLDLFKWLIFEVIVPFTKNKYVDFLAHK